MKNTDYEINGHSLKNIRNSYEFSVIRAMKEQLPEHPEFDNCQICIQDVYGLSVSRIPSNYVQTGTIVMNKKIDDKSISDVVTYAIQQVMNRPKHS